MLNKVSWSEYAGVIVILLIIYYLYIGARYYRHEIKALLSGKLPKIMRKDNAAQKTERLSNDPSFDELEAVVNDLRYSVLDKAANPADKAELLGKIKQRLTNYSGLRKPAYRVAINNYILTNAKELCGVVFSESELNAAWESLLR